MLALIEPNRGQDRYMGLASWPDWRLDEQHFVN